MTTTASNRGATTAPYLERSSAPGEERSVIPPCRADLAVYVVSTTSYFQKRAAETTVRIQVGTVTSVSRTGQILAVSLPSYASDPHPRPILASRLGRGVLGYMPADRVDVEAVLEAYSHHTYPGHPDSIRPLGDNADVHDLIRPFLTSRVLA